ncbi:hypothetical protein [Streptomyces mirabilis]|uniref:WXG100-like domain-containing protein n=1 Tax=Streptomyces mirabilis TaxID=68239 RepID=UPI0033167349
MSGAADKAKEIIQDVTGMWWPDADEGGLRDAAKAWRDFADDIEEVTAAANKSARGIIEHNKGEAISAFDDPYWRRYYYDGHGWLQDMIDGARDMAKALAKYADVVHGAVKRLEHELEIVGATIIAGTALAVSTFGISEAAATAATATIVELAATLGVTVSTEIATIAGTTLATAAFAGIESVTVDLALTQPMSIALGESKGLSLDEVRQAALYGALTGGAFGGGGATVRAVRGAGGWTELLGGVRVAGLEPQVALPGGLTASADDLGLLMKGDGEPNAWPRNKRKGAQKPKYTTDLAADEGGPGVPGGPPSRGHGHRRVHRSQPERRRPDGSRPCTRSAHRASKGSSTAPVAHRHQGHPHSPHCRLIPPGAAVRTVVPRYSPPNGSTPPMIGSSHR